ncbi:tRNA-intron endonuclease [Diplocarpon rosae]|nr:tRNA-intron endonuclease [Diplocarpon rosae]
MAPPATNEMPPVSALQEILTASQASLDNSPHPAHLHHLSSIVIHNLQYEHNWTCITVHTHSPITQRLLLRPIISGLPPKKAYIHPDEQVDILKAQHTTGEKIELLSEREWVLPTHLQEKMSLAKFAAIFDALDTVPPGDDETESSEGGHTVGAQWQGKNRQKRMLLATASKAALNMFVVLLDDDDLDRA